MPTALTIGGAFTAAAARVPGRAAIEFEGRATTYAELEASSRRLAVGLLEGAGLRPGERVGLLMPNVPGTELASSL